MTLPIVSLDDLVKGTPQPRKNTGRVSATSPYIEHVKAAAALYAQDESGIKFPVPFSRTLIGKTQSSEFSKVANELRRAGSQCEPKELFVRVLPIYDGVPEDAESGSAFLWFTARERPWRKTKEEKAAEEAAQSGGNVAPELAPVPDASPESSEPARRRSSKAS